MYRRKDREASLIEPKSQAKTCSAHAEILQQNEERTVYRLRETDGEVCITAYPVFPGIELAYHDVHAPSYRLAEPNAAGLIEIQHCREGRAEYCCGGEHYFLAPGDLSVVRRAAIEGEVEFPTGHYHGITVTLDPALAPDCLSCILQDVDVRPSVLAEKFFADSECFVSRSSARVEHIFSECPDITAVIQFAAYKAVGESVSKPIEYYYNNLNCTLVILDVMRHHNCHNFVFSSSATVYGDPASVPITEDFPTGATTNPYGTTKVFTERILQDVCKADPSLNVALLRYFNPIGAHKSGLIGEDPNGIPNNLMPYIAKVAVGKLEKVHVFGNDYPTPDGTGVRDYIHVVDLARGHVCAIKKLETNCGLFICNLGTGKGYSVLDVIHAFSKACGKEIPYVIDPRRPGDIAECYADPTKAKNELGWVAEYGIEEMCADSWNWQKNNPDGYHTVK